jgi:hypothetical protein
MCATNEIAVSKSTSNIVKHRSRWYEIITRWLRLMRWILRQTSIECSTNVLFVTSTKYSACDCSRHVPVNHPGYLNTSRYTFESCNYEITQKSRTTTDAFLHSRIFLAWRRWLHIPPKRRSHIAEDGILDSRDSSDDHWCESIRFKRLAVILSDYFPRVWGKWMPPSFNCKQQSKSWSSPDETI